MKNNNSFLILSVVVVIAVLSYLIVDFKDFNPKNASGSLVDGIEDTLDRQKHDLVQSDEDLKMLLQDSNFKSMMNNANFKYLISSPSFIELAPKPEFQVLMKSDTFWKVIENRDSGDLEIILYSE